MISVNTQPATDFGLMEHNFQFSEKQKIQFAFFVWVFCYSAILVHIFSPLGIQYIHKYRGGCLEYLCFLSVGELKFTISNLIRFLLKKKCKIIKQFIKRFPTSPFYASNSHFWYIYDIYLHNIFFWKKNARFSKYISKREIVSVKRISGRTVTALACCFAKRMIKIESNLI